MPLGITQLGYYKENRKSSSGTPSADCSGSLYSMPCITADNSVLTFVRWAARFLAFMGLQPILPHDRSSQGDINDCKSVTALITSGTTVIRPAAEYQSPF